MTELENIMLNIEDSSKAQVESATARLHSKTSEASTFKLENERLKVGGFTLKWTKRQNSGQMSQIFKTVKIIEIQPVRQTEVCGKV